MTIPVQRKGSNRSDMIVQLYKKMPKPAKVVLLFGFFWIVVVSLNFKSAEQNDKVDIDSDVGQIELEQDAITTSVIDTETEFQVENSCAKVTNVTFHK